ncbi:putative cyclic nucleotide-gated ion channel 19 [Medicago truncatula]|uniref:putative cyclic nucleotide-gated ion channel 19 n=1 Tax=Medicago truncatula TaxID=3880 RepID=UPI0019685723|nr:putative cyclic nucleotide-gated ion channel 19 [Medicago truncatula]
MNLNLSIKLISTKKKKLSSLFTYDINLHLCHPVVYNSVSLVESKNVKIQGQGLTSDRTVKCLTNVEAFSLDAKDIEEVTTHFARFLRSPRVQQVIRYQSPYWRSLAANRIQVAWRSRKKRLRRANTTQNYYQTLRS